MRHTFSASAAILWLLAGSVFGESYGNRVRPNPVAGRIAWFDIPSSNLPQAREFYGKLFGWEFAAIPDSKNAVEILNGGVTIGAIRAPNDKGGSPGPIYVQVDEVSASSLKARKLGATILPGYPQELPYGAGSIAIVTDPSGYTVGLFAEPAIESGTSYEYPPKIPDKGCVPDAATAIKIAEAVWEPVYGKRAIMKERPFQAFLVRDVWHVFRKFPQSKESTRPTRLGEVNPPPPEEPKGGSLELEIRRRDGSILKLANTGKN